MLRTPSGSVEERADVVALGILIRRRALCAADDLLVEERMGACEEGAMQYDDKPSSPYLTDCVMSET